MLKPSDEDVEKLIDNLNAVDAVEICGVDTDQRVKLRLKLKSMDLTSFNNYTKRYTGAEMVK